MNSVILVRNEAPYVTLVSNASHDRVNSNTAVSTAIDIPALDAVTESVEDGVTSDIPIRTLRTIPHHANGARVDGSCIKILNLGRFYNREDDGTS